MLMVEEKIATKKTEKVALANPEQVKIVAPRKAVTKKEVKQTPKKEKKKIEAAPLVDPWTILQYPHLTEKSIGLVEGRNTLVFIVDSRVTKPQVKWAIERAFDVSVRSVNILNDQKNRKKAFVKLVPENNALDIATRLGMI